MLAASALIGGLGGEKERWTQQSKEFDAQIGRFVTRICCLLCCFAHYRAYRKNISFVFSRLVGDVLVATGFLSYAGPFNQEYRDALLSSWQKEMRTRSIPNSKDLNVTGMLVDSATVHLNTFWQLVSSEIHSNSGSFFVLCR
jgi:dynein heavy chain